MKKRDRNKDDFQNITVGSQSWPLKSISVDDIILLNMNKQKLTEDE